MPKKLISRKDQVHRDHEKFLRKMGVDPTKRLKLTGVEPSALVATSLTRHQGDISLSNNVPGNGCKRDLQLRHARGEETDDTINAILARSKSVAQLYPKGPFGPVSDPDHLKTNVRRPPV